MSTTATPPGARWSRQRSERGPLGGAGRQDEQRVQGEEREAEATGVGKVETDEIGLDERQPVLALGGAARASRARASIAGSRSTPVTS